MPKLRGWQVSSGERKGLASECLQHQVTHACDLARSDGRPVLAVGCTGGAGEEGGLPFIPWPGAGQKHRPFALPLPLFLDRDQALSMPETCTSRGAGALPGVCAELRLEAGVHTTVASCGLHLHPASLPSRYQSSKRAHHVEHSRRAPPSGNPPRITTEQISHFNQGGGGTRSSLTVARHMLSFLPPASSGRVGNAAAPGLSVFTLLQRAASRGGGRTAGWNGLRQGLVFGCRVGGGVQVRDGRVSRGDEE